MGCVETDQTASTAVLCHCIGIRRGIKRHQQRISEGQKSSTAVECEWGSEGRKFESCRPDVVKPVVAKSYDGLCFCAYGLKREVRYVCATQRAASIIAVQSWSSIWQRATVPRFATARRWRRSSPASQSSTWQRATVLPRGRGPPSAGMPRPAGLSIVAGTSWSSTWNRAAARKARGRAPWRRSSRGKLVIDVEAPRLARPAAVPVASIVAGKPVIDVAACHGASPRPWSTIGGNAAAGRAVDRRGASWSSTWQRATVLPRRRGPVD
jgi:hypothetical protein